MNDSASSMVKYRRNFARLTTSRISARSSGDTSTTARPSAAAGNNSSGGPGLPITAEIHTPGSTTKLGTPGCARYASLNGAAWQTPRRRTPGDALLSLVTQGSLQAAIFRSDDLDTTFEKVRASGAEVLQEPASQPWGARDRAFRDPSGNLVRIAQA